MSGKKKTTVFWIGNMKKPTMYVVDGQMGYFRPWSKLFTLVTDPKDAQSLLFTGGEDISPALYGEENVQSGWNSPRRDAVEKAAYEYAVKHKLPMVGICRGAQMICALSGGRLFQHVDHHTGRHEMITHDGQVMDVSSLHHQMLRPAGNFELRAWSTPRSKQYVHASAEGKKVVLTKPDLGKDPEAVWYPDIKAYCIQGHPEFMHDDARAVAWFRNEVKQLIVERM